MIYARTTMVELVRKQRHFLQLLAQTTPKQRKQLLKTVTRDQLRAIAQIAHNIIRSIIVLSPADKDKLKRHRRLIHLLGNRKIGYDRKKSALSGHYRSILTLIQIAVPHLKEILV